MTVETKIVRDGFLSLLGGMDSGRNPSLLQADQAAFLLNCMVRGGFAENRYGYKQRRFNFTNSEVETWYTTKLFQGYAEYRNDFTSFFVVSVGGRIFKLDVLRDYAVTEITPTSTTTTTANFISPSIGSTIVVTVTDASEIFPGYPITIASGRYAVNSKALNNLNLTNIDAEAGINVTSGTAVYFLDANNPNRPIIWTLQAEQYLIIQDGSDAAIIFDGATARRASTAAQEIPTGTAMAYWQGRIWVAVGGGREIAAGDIVDGPTDILSFTEEIYLAEGGRFRVPSNLGTITAMQVLPVLDTSLGQGPLNIFTETSISTLNLPVTRALWKDITQPLQTVALLNYGAKSQNSTVVINGDVFFRSQDGLRSFVQARREFGSPGNVPISREIHRIIKDDSTELLKFCSGILFDNLFLFTVSPLPLKYGAFWRGLGVMDFDLISSLGQKAPPVWSGMWTGVNIMQIGKGAFDGIERAFLFTRNKDGENELWEIDPKSRFDNDCGRIKSVIESRSMDFGSPLSLNELGTAELWHEKLEGTTDFDLKWRPDQYPCWFDWAPKESCAKTTQCPEDVEACFSFPTHKLGYKTRLSFQQPPDHCAEFEKRPARQGYQHQIRLQWEGHAQIKAFLIKALIKSEPPWGQCD